MSETSNLEAYFGDLPDPRVIGRCEYQLVDILLSAIGAVLSGAEGWEDLEEFGQSKEGWSRQFLELANGIPVLTTFVVHVIVAVKMRQNAKIIRLHCVSHRLSKTITMAASSVGLRK